MIRHRSATDADGMLGQEAFTSRVVSAPEGPEESGAVTVKGDHREGGVCSLFRAWRVSRTRGQTPLQPPRNRSRVVRLARAWAALIFSEKNVQLLEEVAVYALRW